MKSKKEQVVPDINGYVMPFELELEKIVLGSIIVDSHIIDSAIVNLRAEDFYHKSNQVIFDAILSLHSKGLAIDLITVINELKPNKEVQNLDQYIIELANRIGTTFHFEDHVKLLVNISIKRNLILNSYQIIQNSFNEEKNGSEVLAESIATLNNMIGRIEIRKPLTFKEKYIKVLKSLSERTGELIGYSTGFNLFDKLTSGLNGPDLIIVAGSPGEGKSTFALNIATHVALTHGQVLFFSLEMKDEQLIYKLISNDCNTSVLDVRKGIIPSGIQEFVKTSEAQLKIFDKGGYTIDEIVGTAKYESIENETKLIVVDYLQLISSGSYGKRTDTRNDEVTKISRRLKQLAMDLNVPVIVLSQVNRSKNRKTYVLSDLRESGAIEQDADEVVFIFRPVIHNLDEYSVGDDKFDVEDDDCVIIIEKHRLGTTGEFRMKFKGEFSRFEDLQTENKQETLSTQDYLKNDPLNKIDKEFLPF